MIYQFLPCGKAMGSSRNTSSFWILLVSVVALSSACLVVPKTRTTSTKVGDRVVRKPAKSGDALYSTQVTGAEVLVEATHTQCINRTIGIFEVTKESRVGIAGGGDSRLAGLFFPITLVSAVVTAAEVSSHKPEVSEREEFLGSEQGPCLLPAAGLRVSLYLPSGTRLWALTDEQGRVSFPIPLTEPRSGQLVLRVRGDSWVENYQRPDVLLSLDK